MSFFVKITLGEFFMSIKDVDKNKATPMMRQYIDIKEKNMDVILFFRLGDFYEMFFEDAVIASKELELTLTGKSAGFEERVPMCGIPHHSANIYIEKLVEKGYKVAICEQLEDASSTKGIVKRDIVQIVSKGTVINQESLIEYENNYIGSVIPFQTTFALAYTDISTGVVYTTLVELDSLKLVNEIISVGLKEVIITSKIDEKVISILKEQFHITVSIFDDVFVNEDYKYIYEDLSDFRYIDSIKHLLSYIEVTQKRNLSHFQKVIVKNKNDYLKMDIHTKRNLELTETIRLKERTYSLIWLLDKTKTAMGSRMLKNYIENPLIDIEKINKRYDIVDTLTNEFILKNDLQTLLDEVYDLERLSGRIAFGNANGRDLLQLKNSVKVLPEISNILEKINYYENFEPLNDLFELLDSSINENPPISIKEGSLIKDGYNEELDELKNLRKGGKDFLTKFEAEEKERTGIKNLKVGYNRVFGYYIEVSKGQTHLVKDEYGYERKQTLSNCERYISPILKEKEALILNSEEKILELEYELFLKIRDQVKKYIPKLQTISKIISEIDVLQSFSTVSEANRFIRPTLINKQIIEIKDNRHPVVEKVINSEYVPNDIIMDENTSILLITGPNMAGKSTYMRQLAITVIMAQIGCFVPATKAVLPVFDAIFTRIGASDDLVSGMSTFMVEMNEANHAIQNATPKSLILFDELGRGTATFDGIALAQSLLEYIHHQIGAKTLFSTHYHELTDLEESLLGLKNVHVSAYEEDGKITFLHKVKEGSVDKSYGIHVAKLANLPDSLIKRANDILNVYEQKEIIRDIKIDKNFVFETNLKKSKIEEKLELINPLEISPMEALNILNDLVEEYKKNK